MRNYPFPPAEQQVAVTEEQLQQLVSNDSGREAFKSDVTGEWKAFEKRNGQYTKWTQQGYASPEEALAAL